MHTNESLCRSLLHLGWGRELHNYMSFIAREIELYRLELSSLSFRHNMSTDTFLSVIGSRYDNLIGAAENIVVQLDAPGIAILETASFAANAASSDNDMGKSLANLCVAASCVISAKMMDVWATLSPIAYLNWYILNTPEEFSALGPMRMAMLEYATANTALKCRPSLTVLHDETSRHSTVLTTSNAINYNGDIDLYINLWIANGYDII